MLFRNWLDEGYYQEDDYGDLYRVENPYDLHDLQISGKLYYNDGMSTNRVDQYDDIDYNQFKI